MAVKIFGTKKDSASASTYPGITSHRMEMPVSTRSMARPTDTDTPMDRLFCSAAPEMAPSVKFSTCLSSTYTAGSALTMK